MRGCKFSLGNALAFVASSFLMLLIGPTSLSVILAVPFVFFVGAVASFALLIRSGGAFAPIAWFILGAGVYFGLGVVVSGVAPAPESLHYGSSSVLLSDLLRINLLNSTSVALVLITAVPLAYRVTRPRVLDQGGPQQTDHLLLRLFPALTMLALGSVGLQFMFFPLAENLLVRTALSYLQIVVPFCLLTLGMIWTKLESKWRAVGALVSALAFAVSLLTMSKLAIVCSVVPLVVGSWVYRRSMRSISAGLIVMAVVYGYGGALANAGRSHSNYDSLANSPLTRVAILADSVAGGDDTLAHISGPEPDLILPTTVLRFSVADVQAYLMTQYDNHQPGASLDDAWVAAVPRLLWPDKPVVTRFGPELYEQMSGNAGSAMAPTYAAEAYWNYGALGVIAVSILIGLEIGWLTQRWHIAADGLDPAFFVVAFPTALSASYVESWIAANYIGGFLTIVMLWAFTKLVIVRLFRGALFRIGVSRRI